MRIASLLLTCGALPAFCAAPLLLMPLPVKMEAGQGRLLLDRDFTVTAAGSNARLKAAAARLMARLSRQTGLRFLPSATPSATAARLTVEAAGGPAMPELGEDESYTLDVAATQATLRAATVEGAIHGMETFAQLARLGADGFEVPAVHIEDGPRFPWRGLMIDACRHWMPVEVVKRNLDAMAAVKLNVLHWHLSEDQGVRVESKRYPRLQELGSNGEYYTQEQIRDVVAYAAARAIRVIPEFDIPGHTTAMVTAYPELASAPGPYSIETRFGVFDAALDPSKESTYEFLDGFIGEMAGLFPDAFFHIGGDEVKDKQWKESAPIQAFAKAHGLADARALQVYFNQRIQKTLEKYGKTMIGWDEVLAPGLPQNTVVHSWRGQKSLAEAAAKGYRGILSSGYYLDHIRTAGYHYAVDPLGAETAQLSAADAARILGGEACMWAELANAETVDSRLWPRAAAIAERLWSPKEVTDVDSMYARLEAVSRMLEWTGVRHRANYQPMLERLAGERTSAPLRVLADALEARGLGQGRSSGRNTTATPFNRMVDAARPESETVRAVELAVKRFLAAPSPRQPDVAFLRAQFQEWAANDARLQPLFEGNPLLAELKPISRDLAALGAAGLKLLDDRAAGRATPKSWLTKQGAEVARLQKPAADMLLAAVRPVKLLLDAPSAARKKTR
jgi:hexosaminidase